MKKNLSRKAFLKYLGFTGAAALLAQCGIGEPKKPQPTPDKSIPAASNEAKGIFQSNGNVTFVKPADAEFENLRQGFNKRIQKTPAIIALCHNTQGVAEAMKLAALNGMPVAVKSGGHCFEGFSSNNGGMVINMSKMNQLTWESDENIKLGPGLKLGQLYDQVLPKGRVLPAGSCAGVGIGGLALGGGYGFFSREYGLTCDHLQSVTMVDGQGNILNSDDDPELLWACRGGGNGNFGVVTEMTFRTHQAPATFQSHRLKTKNLDAARAKGILEKWFELAEKLPNTCFSAFVLNGKSLLILLTNYGAHTADVQGFMDGLAPLCDKNTPGAPVPLAKALTTFYGRPNPLFFKNSSAGLYSGYAEIEVFLDDVLTKVTQTPNLIYQINTLGGAIQNQAFAETSSYPHRSKPFLSELQCYWEKEGGGETLMKTFKEVQDTIQAAGINSQYVNYPNLEFADAPKVYYGENLERLKQLKKRLDPNNTVRHDQSL